MYSSIECPRPLRRVINSGLRLWPVYVHPYLIMFVTR